MLLGDARHRIRAVGSKGGWKGTEKVVCRGLLGWGSLAGCGGPSGLPDVHLVPAVSYFPFPEHKRGEGA